MESTLHAVTDEIDLLDLVYPVLVENKDNPQMVVMLLEEKAATDTTPLYFVGVAVSNVSELKVSVGDRVEIKDLIHFRRYKGIVSLRND